MDWTTGPDLTIRFRRFWQNTRCCLKVHWSHKHNLKQNGRPLDAFLTEARLFIQNYGYPDKMQNEIIFGTDHEVVSKKCIMKGNNLSFEKAWDVARTEEVTQAQLRAMDAPVPPTQVDTLSGRQNKSIKSDRPPNRPPRDPTWCQQCGNNQHQPGQPCPASRVECFNCHNQGHFSKMCKTKKANVHEVQGGQHNQSAQGSKDAVNFPSYDSAHNLFLGTLTAEHPKGKTIAELPSQSKVMTKIQFTADPLHRHVSIMVCRVDTGAEVNAISEADYKQIFPIPVTWCLGPAQLLTAYGATKLKLWVVANSMYTTMAI